MSLKYLIYSYEYAIFKNYARINLKRINYPYFWEINTQTV